MLAFRNTGPGGRSGLGENGFIGRGSRLSSGPENGWRLFCAKANLTMLRDQVFPALVRKLRPDEPPAELST